MQRLTLIITIFYIPLFFSSTGCEERSQDSCNLPQCDENRSTIIEASGAVGEIGYSYDLEMYTVTFIPKNSIDSKAVGLACYIPEKFKIIGLMVLFSGECKDTCNDPKSILGKDYYFLHIDLIENY